MVRKNDRYKNIAAAYLCFASKGLRKGVSRKEIGVLAVFAINIYPISMDYLKTCGFDFETGKTLIKLVERGYVKRLPDSKFHYSYLITEGGRKKLDYFLRRFMHHIETIEPKDRF